MNELKYLKFQVIIACIAAFLLLLSDLGLVFVIEDITAKIFTHIGLIVALISSIIQLRNHQNK